MDKPTFQINEASDVEKLELGYGIKQINRVPRLVFCKAKELEDEDPQLCGCNINHSFLRLAHRHVRRDSNGLFGSRTVVEKDGRPIFKHDSWCCFKIKQVRKEFRGGHAQWDIDYEWQQPSVYISWNTKDRVTLVLCMDTPPELEKAIQDAWDDGSRKTQNPYEWYCLITEKITDLYDESIWKLRDFVREDVEKKRSPESTNFERLHDIARHIIHSNETLEVALSTLDGMQQAHRLFSEEICSSDPARVDFSFRHTQLELSDLTRTVKASFLRSKSLHDRIHNEINLAYNLVNQRDSSLMKTIAIMSLVYLPGSWISSIFGMNFFDFSSSTGLVLSDKFWLYWALTAAMTLLTVGTWMVWQSRSQRSSQPDTHDKSSHNSPSELSKLRAWYGTSGKAAAERKTTSPV